MRIGVRSQWVGFDGAPLNQFASVSGRVGSEEGVIQGFGAYVLTDAIGPWSNTRLNVAYSARVRLSSGSRLSAGLGLGVAQYKLDKVSLNLPETGSAADPALLGSNETQLVFPTLDMGFWYEDRKTFASFSALNLTKTPLNNIASGTSPASVFIVSGGRYVPLDERFAFKPAMQLRKAAGAPASVDFRGSFSMNKKVGLGLGYRTRSALIATMNFKLLESLSVGYAYDFGVSSLNPAARHSHEIVLTISACDKNDPFFGSLGRCPAYE
jgi:type IX secretion system PorP/SprF family membrane protein